MVKVSLTIEGDAEEVIAAIRELAGSDTESAASVSETVDDDVPDATPESTTASNVSSPAAPPVPEGRWTIDHVRTFWRYLAPNAQQVYHQVAHSSGYVMSRQSLLDAMGLTERQLSGRMSSVGPLRAAHP